MGSIIAFLGGVAARFLTVGVAKYIAVKALLIGLFTLVLPVILYNVFTRILQEIISEATNRIGVSGMSSVVFTLSGFGAWIGTNIQAPAAFSIIISAVALRFSLNLIGK